MKHPEDFSDAAVNKRSLQASRELEAATRSAKVKRVLNSANMDKKERRPLKEFTDFRTEISEHVGVPAPSMPPNILILRRKTVRQFPGNLMVALYFNDKLGQYFSIPYGSAGPDDAVITPVALKEEELNEISIPVATRAYHARQNRGLDAMNKGDYSTALPHFKKALTTMRQRSKKYEREDKGDTVKEEVITEDAISHLQKVKAFKTSEPLYHKDKSQTKVDPQTANMLLTVYHSLHPDNRKKFTDALEHSRPKFHKVVDFGWKQVM